MAEGQFGTATIEQALQIFYNEINAVDSQLADGFQGSDLFSILLQLSPITSVLQAKEKIADEWKDLSDEEILSSAKYFNAGLNLRNKETQTKIQNDVTAVAYAAIAIRGHFSKKAAPTV